MMDGKHIQHPEHQLPDSKPLFNPLEHPACLEFPLWLNETAWAEHIPFAMFIVSALRPRILVELGTYYGVSYCAFCQAVKFVQSSTKCYAVDTWLGDLHAGEVDEAVLAKLQTHHDPLYAEFSRFLRSTFDEALPHFADGSVDLLHIDGLHTYEAVRHDFETWLPKMSQQGVVLFHDINVRERGFGVWQLWDELSACYPNFAFLHGHGLGVLGVGKDLLEGVSQLFEADETQTFLIRRFFHQVGARIEAVNNVHKQNECINLLRTYEKTVLDSRAMRANRALLFAGLRKFWQKARKRQ